MKNNYLKTISGKFWISVCVTVLLCTCSRFWGNAGESDSTVLQAFFRYSKSELFNMGEEGSAYYVTMGFRDMEWFIVALPLLSAFPSVYDFAEQWLGGSYYMLISKKTRMKYAIQSLLKAALAGFGVVVLGIFLYTLCVYLKFPKYHLYQLTPEESMAAISYGFTDLSRWLSFLKSVFHVGLLSAMAAMISTVLVIVIRDRFLAISLPMLAEYFSIKLNNVYQKYLYRDEVENIPVRKHIPEFFMPSNHLYYDRNFSITFEMTYWEYLALMGAIILLIFALFWWVIERRSE